MPQAEIRWVFLWSFYAVVVGVIAWALWQSNIARRSYEEELAAWAAERAAHAERLRIARDLHDLASHGLGLITVRAAAANTATGPTADRERQAALGDVETASRAAMQELRRMLGVLRSPEAAPLVPTDTLAELPSVVDAARASGLAVTLAVEEHDDPALSGDPGSMREISPGAQLTAVAVVREALNNVIRHAGPTSARVSVHRARDAVIVEVTNEPNYPAHTFDGGHGLIGLRERVSVLGGDLSAGPGPGGDWRVVARIPDRGTE